MGVVWSSPYRRQLLAVCFGLFVLTTGLVFLLLSIGLQDALWRLAGGVCASMGSALAVTGTCWCVWVVRHGLYGDTINMADCEADALTGEGIISWHEAAGCPPSRGFRDDVETDEQVEYEAARDEDGREESQSQESHMKRDVDECDGDEDWEGHGDSECAK